MNDIADDAFDDEIAHISPNRASRIMLWGLIGFIVLAVAWAAWAEVDRTVRGAGRVVPSSQLQVVSNLEGGVVEDILVEAGAIVADGEPLIRLDPTATTADFGSGQASASALDIKIARLSAELSGSDPRYPPARDAAAAQQIAIERALHASRLADLGSMTAAANARIVQTERAVAEARAAYQAATAARDAAASEERIIRPLVERGIEPRLSLVQAEGRARIAASDLQSAAASISRAEAGVAEARASLSQIRQDWRAQAAGELAAAQAEYTSRQSAIPALEDRVARTVIRAPLAGRVNRVLVTTRGAAISPGQPLVEIVPSDERLLVEARIGAKDIGYVRIGQVARVAFTAYDQSLHGTLAGSVVTISPDSLVDENTGEIYYQVRVQTNATALESPTGQTLPIGPGMVTEVGLLGEKRSILSYILTPITRLGDRAFRE